MHADLANDSRTVHGGGCDRRGDLYPVPERRDGEEGKTRPITSPLAPSEVINGPPTAFPANTWRAFTWRSLRNRSRDCVTFRWLSMHSDDVDVLLVPYTQLPFPRPHPPPANVAQLAPVRSGSREICTTQRSGRRLTGTITIPFHQ